MVEQKKSHSNEPENETVKQRKQTSGPLRDKSRTMARLVVAVGKVIQKDGYTGLTATNIAKAAGLDKKLIWTYFGSVDSLIEEYISKKDFWKQAANNVITDLLKNPTEIGQDQITKLLQNQLEIVLKDKALQKIIHWEIGEKNKMLRDLADKREEIGEGLFQVIIPHFEKENIYNIRGRLALLIGGIYYLSLHAKSNGSMFCGLDINKEEGKKEVLSAINDLISLTYENANIT
ncbi:TetR/AcrR family transcriptional regulator [Myroides odoratus]|uniref:TetR/AcrR family transcriptional regulator n=1 Tax=Myroides odoratus TaxID=256 RepID=A0A9Q6Z4T7_MYROD|nr:TetR/AcrR family transcriptional regulator [Myroides odoratus]EHQ41402.1 regulatory protein TetR [Myroides odoratus DSM 2801]EKB08727.1 hypothetical protein HMPREF9716_00778 [Myroides odoratus CIP 103059]QQT98836.1 TetR/AcrR family transcriptional regulator [Myroides odoratus]WQD58980.1 TetR/AcrR family transcriptional regulator [Myroides odoratus]STZ32441.1 transcriptional repressor BetI [Myroides odoratus]